MPVDWRTGSGIPREMKEHLKRSGLTGEELVTELERKRELLNSQLAQIIDEAQAGKEDSEGVH